MEVADNRSMKILLFLVALISIALVSTTLIKTVGTSSPASSQAENPAERQGEGRLSPVVVELFTSEGCSSCPSADQLLAQLASDQPIDGARLIPLSMHVDYWDHIGWKDPFGSVEFTVRQNQYAVAFGLENVYTPQAIVAGETELIGSRGRELKNAIAKAAKRPTVSLIMSEAASESRPSAMTVKITIDSASVDLIRQRCDLMVAVTESGLFSDVSAGENSGKHLTHVAVTRLLVRVAPVEPELTELTFDYELPIDPTWQPDQLEIVTFLQESKSRSIIGAASMSYRQLFALEE